MEPIQEGLFEINEDNTGHLLTNRCEQCDLNFYPRRQRCLECGQSDKLVDGTLNKNGTLYSFTVVHRALPVFKTPYIIGYVDLESVGLRIFALISDSEPEDLEIGMEMEPFFEPMQMKDPENNKMVCKFRPAKKK